MKQDSLNLVVSDVQTLSLLSKLIERTKDGEQLKTDDINLVLRQLSAVLISTQKNTSDTAAKSKFQTNICHNIIFSSNCTAINSEDDSPMYTDAEACDSDDQSEPEINYQQELLSRMMYYGDHKPLEISTPSKSSSVPSSRSTPLTSSTILKVRSTQRHNRRKDRSTPLASSTMMEDLVAELENNQPSIQTGNNSIVTWSIDDDNTKTTSLNNSLSIDFEMTSADISNRNGMFPRTSTSTDLLKNINSKSTNEKKMSKGKQHVTRLMFIIRKINRNLTKKNSSKEKSIL